MAEYLWQYENAIYTDEEKSFHDLVRDWVISLLVLLLLLSASYGVLLLFRREPEIDDFSANDKEDTVVYHAAFVICVFTLSAALSCTLLLPASVACNEILLMYPDSYYLQWINGSLVTKFWDLAFYFSRALIFLLLPFIYLFTEAIGFVGMRHGVMARVYEAVAVMILVGFVLFGLFFLGMAMIYSYEDLLISDVWHFLDRLVTALGFIFLLISTPVGYAFVFQSAAGKSLPFLQRRQTVVGIAPSTISTLNLSAAATTAAERKEVLMMQKEVLLRRRNVATNGDINSGQLEDSQLDAINNEIQLLQRQMETKKSLWKSLLSWLFRLTRIVDHLSPLLCAFLAFGLAILSALSTLFTVFERALTSRTLPNYDEKLRLGHESLSRLGIFGSSLGLLLQTSCAAAALIGIYNLPTFKLISPRRGDTPMTRLILNCTIWILLAQAFPSFSSCLGLTNFQLLSGFRSSSDWLLLKRSSVYIVVIIDAIYIAFVALHLVNSLTAPLVREFVDFIIARWQRFRSHYAKSSNSNPTPSKENHQTVTVGANGDSITSPKPNSSTPILKSNGNFESREDNQSSHSPAVIGSPNISANLSTISNSNDLKKQATPIFPNHNHQD